MWLCVSWFAITACVGRSYGCSLLRSVDLKCASVGGSSLKGDDAFDIDC